MTRRALTFALFVALTLLIGAKASLLFSPAHFEASSMEAAPIKVAASETFSLDSHNGSPLAKDHAGSGVIKVRKAVKEVSEFSQFLPDVINTAHAENIPQRAAASTGSTSEGISEDILQNIRAQKDALNERQKRLDTREKSIQQATEKLNIRITELQQLESSIQQRLQDEKNIKNKKIKRLTAVYEGMKPDRAAPVISKMDLGIVVRVFLLMDEKKVGKILSYLPPDKAVQISQALTRQISSVK